MKTQLYSTENLYGRNKFQATISKQLNALRRSISLGLILSLLLATSNVVLAGTGIIGDRVWNDEDENGKQDSGEGGISGINVDLEIYGGPTSPSTADLADPANWTILASATTNGSGNYRFTALEAAYYRVKFGLQTGYIFSTPLVGSGFLDRANDSNAEADGYTSSFFLADGEVNRTIDAGMFDNTAMPVSLATFDVKKEENNSVTLNWTTTEEVNSDYFGVEQSRDGRSWIEIGRVESNGNYAGLAKYHYVNDKTYAGVNYYRLKMVDTDGTFAYSSIKTVSLENGGSGIVTTAYPNPSSTRLFVKTSLEDEISGAKMYNITGKVVLQANAAQTQSGVNVEGLPEGLYIMSVSLKSGKTENQKVMIVK